MHGLVAGVNREKMQAAIVRLHSPAQQCEGGIRVA